MQVSHIQTETFTVLGLHTDQGENTLKWSKCLSANHKLLAF